MPDGYLIFLAVCLGIIVYQLLWTWLHNRTLKRHMRNWQIDADDD